MNSDGYWLSGMHQVWDSSKLLALIMFAVISTGLNCFFDIFVASFCISKDQMSMHELSTIEIGGLEEEDDPY